MAGCPHIFHLIRVRKKARRMRIYWSAALGVTGEGYRYRYLLIRPHGDTTYGQTRERSNWQKAKRS
jgi:hypothetical protein